MISNDTVLVLGAGASCPFGFPTGQRLRELICTPAKTDIGGLSDEQRLMQCGFHPTTIAEFKDQFLRSGCSSIDAFLATRHEFGDLGKAVIANVLVPMEEPDRLYTQISPTSQKLRHGDSNWYQLLWDAMRNGCMTADQVPANNISFITFNYDRSLEQFLTNAIRFTYGVTGDEALAIQERIPVHHVYGSFGSLKELPYGGTYDSAVIQVAASGLKVMPSTRPPFDPECRRMLEKARQMAFLGFGFDEVNCARLGFPGLLPPPGAGAPRVSGTVFGFTDGQTDVAMKTICANGDYGERFVNVDCAEFLRRFPRLLS